MLQPQGYVMAGVDSETGERVCAKINHNDEYEGSAAQKKEIMLHMALKHGAHSPHPSSAAACSASSRCVRFCAQRTLWS